ncbi:MAG TPA: helix-turn-helix domain-containing protein, partial [Microbacteriaceae bacterium]|nr:helix-turn-helix domain-containing protein [Microbacteriaceae bacterium]
MALASPHADVRPSALPKPYSPPAPPSNTLAAFAPVTWPSGRVVPRAELAAVLETPAGRELGASAAMVFTALWTWASVGGVAWPCAESIAHRAHVSRRTVFRALAQLEGAGLVVRRRPSLRARRRHRESNTYQLAPVVALPPSPPAESPRPPRRVAPPRPSSASSPPRPALAAPPSPSPALAELGPAAAGPAGQRDQVPPWHPK